METKPRPLFPEHTRDDDAKMDICDDHDSTQSPAEEISMAHLVTPPRGASQPLADARCCAQCGTTQTPQWRNGPRGPRTLCNACGIRLHRRLNKTKMGTTPRRRKKVPRASRPLPPASFTIPKPRYLKQQDGGIRFDHDSLNNAQGGDVVYLDRRSRRKATLSSSYRQRSTSSSSQAQHAARRVRSRRIAESALKKKKKAASTTVMHRARSFRCEDFTAAIDLMSLSKERYRSIGKSLNKLQDRYECLKSEVGVSDGDLLACSQALPKSSAPDFKRIQSELVTAQWEVQAAEIGTRTVAEILAECSEEAARKRTKYWEARSELESFIMKHFKAKAQP